MKQKPDIYVLAAIFLVLVIVTIINMLRRQDVPTATTTNTEKIATTKTPKTIADYKAYSIDRLRQMAIEGDAGSQLELANRYVLGNGVPQNPEESVKWYRLAADQGLPEAQFNLGNAYQRGRGVDIDMEQAKRYWAMAAQQGLAAAQLNLGIRLVEERGIDDKVGLELLNMAAKQGHPSAKQTLQQIDDYRAYIRGGE